MKDRRFTRKDSGRQYHKRFIVIPEGELTEPSYFRMLKQRIPLREGYRFAMEKTKGHEIPQLLKHARSLLPLRKGDEVWMVLDRDPGNRTEEQFQQLAQWEAKDGNHVALSTPRFEYWLLLHFEKTPSAQKAQQDSSMAFCMDGKEVKADRFTETHIRDAVERACQPQPPASIPTCREPDALGSGMGLLVKRWAGW